ASRLPPRRHPPPRPTRRSSDLGDFGTVAYNTEEDKHIFLFPGDISQGITPGFQVRLSAGDGVEGSGSAFSMSSLDPSSELESVQIGRAHVNSSHVKISYAVFCL